MFQATRSALCYSLSAGHAGEAPQLAPPYNDVVNFVAGQQGRMTDYLRLPLAALTVTFGLAGLLRGGRPFHRQPPHRRAEQVAAWRRSALTPCRELIRFYESLTLLALYARAEDPHRPEMNDG